MRPRTIRVSLLLGLLAAPLGAEAQPAGRVYRIGYLSSGSPEGGPHLLPAVRQGLRELRWVEGQNITIDYRFAEGRFVVPDSTFQLHRARLAELAARGRRPAAYGLSEYVEAGGLISYGADITDIWRRAAVYVDKILKGAEPGDLPVEQPTKFELVINLKTARPTA